MVRVPGGPCKESVYRGEVHGLIKTSGEYHRAHGVRAERQYPARHQHQKTLQARSVETDTKIDLLNLKRLW